MYDYTKFKSAHVCVELTSNKFVFICIDLTLFCKRKKNAENDEGEEEEEKKPFSLNLNQAKIVDCCSFSFPLHLPSKPLIRKELPQNIFLINFIFFLLISTKKKCRVCLVRNVHHVYLHLFVIIVKYRCVTNVLPNIQRN